MKRKRFAIILVCGLLLALAPSLCAPAWATPARPAHGAPAADGPADPKELEAFIDGFFARQMQESHIPGAVFVLVKDGQIFFEKGYGYADLDRKTPLDPDKTVLRIKSVSKLFTATAVMQMVERGQLKLDADVNQYLKLFKIPPTYPQPVTVANLLTHTSGFEDKSIGSMARTEGELTPLGPYLATHIPPRIHPPGEFINYSDQGMSLAGYLVQEVSGVPFAQYVDENIFKPLNMRRSSFTLPADLAPDLAVGYRYDDGVYQPVPYGYFNVVPAVSALSTGTDMAHFMIAHLQNGSYESARILDEATAREMHQQHFTYDPHLPGFAYGFYELFKNNQRAIIHDGNGNGFTSGLFLLPDKNLGFFVAYTNDEFMPRQKLVDEFFDHYYPAQPAPAPAPPADFQPGRYTGSYTIYRYDRQSFEKFPTLFSQQHLRADEDGTLMLDSDDSRWVAVAPQLFQRVDGEGYMAVRQDTNGRVTHLLLGPRDEDTLEKVPTYETLEVQAPLNGILLLIFLSACVGWPIGYLIRRRRSPQPRDRSLPARLARPIAGLISAVYVIASFGVAFLLVRDLGVHGGTTTDYGMPPVVVGLLGLALAASVLAITLPVFTVLIWKDRTWGLWGRLHYSLVTLAVLVFIWGLYYWNMLGFHF